MTMFYEHNQVDYLLICAHCNERYDTPHLLPCYRTICHRCIESRSDQQGPGLDCPFCTGVLHPIPDGGFAVNEQLNALLKLKPVDVHKAEIYRRIGDLLKLIQLNINDLEGMESNVQVNLFDYFEMIKTEINTSADNVIEQTVKYRDKLIGEIDYLKRHSAEYFQSLLHGPIKKLKRSCVTKKKEWQESIERRSTNDRHSDDQSINEILSEAKQMNDQLNETKLFIQNTITSRKLIFNQAEPICMSSLIGQLEFNDDALEMIDHRLKVNFLNDIVKVNIVQLEPSLIRQTSFLVPMIYQKMLNVSKESYDEYSSYSLCISDLDGKELAKSCEFYEARVNSVGSYANHILVALTDKKTSREMIKLYNSSLQLVNTTFIESKCEAFYLNDKYIYAKLSPAHPFCVKLNYQLVKQPLFETLTKSCDLFVSFVVDKLVYFSSDTNQVYFNDKCFSRLKIFSEANGNLVASVYVNNLRDCSIRIDASLQNSLNDQFICINKSESWIRCYEIKSNAEESENRVANLVAENFLSDKIKTISNFYLTKDGYYVFIDHLNDSVYIY